MSVSERVLIRFAGPSDLEWCVREDDYVNEKIIREKIVRNEIIIAELDGEAVGLLRYEFFWSTIPFIAMIFVMEIYHREGIGRKLLGFLESVLKEKGFKFYFSSSQVNEPESQAWHRHMGFEECGMISGLNEGSIGEVFFRKIL